MAESVSLPTAAARLSPRRRLLLAVTLAALVALADASGRMVVMLALLLLAPGYLAERALPAPHLPLLARVTVWVALSLSATALLYQWAWAGGIALAAPALWGGVVLLAGAALSAAWHDMGPASEEAWPPTAAQWAGLLSVVIVAVALWARLAEIKGLAFAPWVDSLHHATLVRVAAETGRAPSSLAPYLPVEALPYHWGYHVFIATLLRLSGLGLVETLLLSGQILNALHALVIAGLAGQLWRRPLAAPVAALVVGLISLMPAYYLSWGRYTHLTGLLLLPGLALAWRAALDGRGRGWWLISAATLAGLSLVHFIVLSFGLALLGALTLVWALGRPWAAARGPLLGALAAGLGGLALASPWLAMLLRRSLGPVLSGGLVGDGSYNAFNSGLLWVGPNYALVALALAGALLGLHRRTGAAAVVLLWVGLMLLGANPWMLGYLLPAAGLLLLLAGLRGLLRLRMSAAPSHSANWPAQPHSAAAPRWFSPAALLALGAGLLLLNPALVELPYLWLINNDAVVISMFMPLALLSGGGAALLAEGLSNRAGPRLRRALAPVGLALLIGAGAWGLRGVSASVLNPGTVLGAPAEREAIAWAAAQTPPEARFLVNAAPWMPDAHRGADGGWWLLPLAGRWTTAPPVLFIYGPPDYVRHVMAVNDTIIGYTPGNEQIILDLIAAERISHIYLVAGRGPLGREIFVGRAGFSVIYERDGVTIIAVEP
jgi:hypothetical protein